MKRRAALTLALLTSLAGSAFAAGGPDSSAQIFDALKAFNAGNAPTARVTLLNVIKSDPDNAFARALDGRVLIALGDGLGAQNELERAEKLGLPHERIAHLLGHAALLQGNIDVALRETDAANVHPMFAAYASRIRGKAFVASGSATDAVREFNRSIKLGPRSSLLWSDIGRFRMMSGDMKGAIDAAEESVRLNPRSIEALILAAELTRQQYGLVAAIPAFERALAVDKTNLIVMIELAATLGDAGRNKDMLAMTRRILELQPKNPQAYYLQAVLAARANKPSLARSLLYRTGGMMDEMPAAMLLRATIEIMQGADEQAIVRLRPLLDIQPTNIKARRLMGAAMWRTGDIKGTIETLSPIAARSDADSYTLNILGRAFEADGNRTEAARLLDRASLPYRAGPTPFGQAFDMATVAKASERAPGDASAVVPFISGLIANGRVGDALARSAALQRSNPGAPAAHVVLGDSLAAAGRWNEAVEAYRRSANIRFSESTALRLVRALEGAKRQQEAVIVLNTFLSQNPRSISARLLASEYFLRTGQWSRAIKLMENLRDRLGDRDAALLNNLAWAYLQSGNTDKAHSFAKASFELAPNNGAVLSTYGWVLTQGKIDLPAGVAALEKAASLSPRNAAVHFQLAQAYAGVGQKDAAKRAVKVALANPQFADRQAAQALLSRL
jgi:cellulose synthase operon protein C